MGWTNYEDFDTVHNVVIDGISDNMAYLVQLGRYGAINAADTTTMGDYVIKYLFESYTLQEDQTTDRQVSKEVKFFIQI